MGWFSHPPADVSPGAPPDPHAAASYARRWWVSLDQFFNVWVLNGLPDETISSHSGRRLRDDAKPPRWARFVCWLCNKFDTDHCKGAIGH